MIDLIIKNAHVATATDTFKCDIIKCYQKLLELTI